MIYSATPARLACGHFQFFLVTSVSFSITLDVIFSYQNCKRLYYKVFFFGISFRVLVENWKHLKDILAVSFLEWKLNLAN